MPLVRPAAVGPVEIDVESLRQTRPAQLLSVSVGRGGALLLEALAWAVADLVGVDHASLVASARQQMLQRT